MNIDYRVNIEKNIEAMQGLLDGKNVQYRNLRSSDKTWYEKDYIAKFNFQECEYRIAPDVVYKIVNQDVITYGTERPDPTVYGKFTKGYWVEGEL